MSDHTPRTDDLAAYVLGSLEPAEATELERHLDGCETCRNELRWLRPAIQFLAESAPPLEPPPELRERLMQEARADAAREAEPVAEPSRERRPFGFRARAFMLRPATALAATALVAAGVGGYALNDGSGGGDGTTTVAQHEPGTGIATTLEREGDSGTMEFTGLRQLPRGAVYETWVQHGMRVEPSSLFAARKDGTASAAIPGHLQGANAVLVTVEPRGGSEQPTSAPVVDLKVS